MMAADWMRDLPEELLSIELNKLAIPGSHNSGTYTLTEQLAPDAPGFLKTTFKAPGIARLFKNVLQKWCQCQRLSIKEQLTSGIRYLDFRVSSKLNNEDLYLVHALYGPKVIQALEEINEFLHEHPGEVIIIDFNHFYAMNANHHRMLISQIKSTFGTRLCEKTEMENLNLKNLTLNHKQIICVYHHEEAIADEDLWLSKSFISWWPNTNSPEICIKKLTGYMDQASTPHGANQFFVCQGILTPNISYTLSPLTRSSIHRMNQLLRPSFFSWLSQSPASWKYQPNIVIHDFVEEENYIQNVLELNKYRLRDENGGNHRT